ncbi:MAG: tRNA-uridine aminocarboxypropyltransferase [Deltaproteobacteria bacterium]
MSRAHPTSPRCVGCRMVVGYCICDTIVPIETETRVVLIVHWMEWNKTTTTSALLNRVLIDAEVKKRGHREAPLDLSEVLDDPTRRAVLLYPSDDAVPLDAFEHDGPLTLIVPDGTWRQARKVRSRVPRLDTVPAVTLPVGAASGYRVRKNVRGDFALSTAEAVARALGILEGAAVEAAVMRPFERMVQQTMRMRGRELRE